jgi:hypothetical protein
VHGLGEVVKVSSRSSGRATLIHPLSGPDAQLTDDFVFVLSMQRDIHLPVENPNRQKAEREEKRRRAYDSGTRGFSNL